MNFQEVVTYTFLLKGIQCTIHASQNPSNFSMIGLLHSQSFGAVKASCTSKTMMKTDSSFFYVNVAIVMLVMEEESVQAEQNKKRRERWAALTEKERNDRTCQIL